MRRSTVLSLSFQLVFPDLSVETWQAEVSVTYWCPVIFENKTKEWKETKNVKIYFQMGNLIYFVSFLSFKLISQQRAHCNRLIQIQGKTLSHKLTTFLLRLSVSTCFFQIYKSKEISRILQV